jgi:small-conductance mechanosensitive channel
VELVMRLLIDAAVAQERVLRDPGPGVNLTNFSPDGLEFTLNYWMADPENGQQNLRSLVNLTVLKALRENSIEIPFPQRVIHASAPLASSLEKMSQAMASQTGLGNLPAVSKPAQAATES